ncbi:MAG: redoxin domain-containing protein [bacterium]
MFKIWQFWIVMVAIFAMTAMLAYGFWVDPKLVKSPLIGRPVPSFSVREMNTGEPLGSASLKGTAYMLNFWGSWCPACRDEAHLLESAHRKWGKDPKRFKVVGIAFNDTLEAARAFARRFGKTYYLALDDEQGTVILNFGLYGAPETFFVDKNSIIRHKKVGALTWEEIEEQVTLLLKRTEGKQ